MMSPESSAVVAVHYNQIIETTENVDSIIYLLYERYFFYSMYYLKSLKQGFYMFISFTLEIDYWQCR